MHWGHGKEWSNGIAVYTSLQGVAAALTGTITSAATETTIVNGGETAILTLTDAEWVPAGAEFDAQRQAIIDGFVSAQSEANGWNAERANIPLTDVVRTSDTVVTITLSALATYSITQNEFITVTVPGSAIDLVGTPLEAGSFMITNA